MPLLERFTAPRLSTCSPVRESYTLPELSIIRVVDPIVELLPEPLPELLPEDLPEIPVVDPIVELLPELAPELLPEDLPDMPVVERVPMLLEPDNPADVLLPDAPDL